jgi:hypothetical protein
MKGEVEFIVVCLFERDSSRKRISFRFVLYEEG